MPMINISSNAEPFHIDASRITAIHAKGEEITIFSAQGEMASLENDDVQGIVRKLAAGGTALHGVIGNYGEMHYVRPSAVEYMTVANDEGRMRKVLIGLAGHEAEGLMTREQVQDLEKAMKADEAKIVSFEPEECWTHWPDATKLHINAAAVVGMRESSVGYAHILFKHAEILEVHDGLRQRVQKANPGLTGEALVAETRKNVVSQKLSMEEWMTRIFHKNLMLTRVKGRESIYFLPEIVAGVSQGHIPAEDEVPEMFTINLHLETKAYGPGKLTLHFGSAVTREIAAVEVNKKLAPADYRRALKTEKPKGA